MSISKASLSVYFIAGTQNFSTPFALLEVLEEALFHGISCFQFREKGKGCIQDAQQIKKLAQSCQSLCHQYHRPFIVNDNIELALACKADGIHLGQADQPISELTKQTKKKLFIGLSIQSISQLTDQKTLRWVDYLGVGPVFTTTSKADAEKPIGLIQLQNIKNHIMDKPIVAIGGIHTNNAQKVRQHGADGIAIISAIAQSKNIKKTLHQLKNTKI